MNIAFVVQEVHKRGGTERAMSELAEALAARGHTILFFSHRKDREVLPDARWYRVPMLRWPSLPRFLSFLIANTLVRAMAHASGERFDVLHSTGPDVLHPAVTTLHCCGQAFADAIQSHPASVDPHRWAALRRWANVTYYRVVALLERYVVRRGASGVITISEALASEVSRANGVSRQRLAVIPNGINVRGFSPDLRVGALRLRAELGIPAGSAVVLFVGYNWERKGLATLVDALAPLDGPGVACDPWLLVVGGRGNPAQEHALAQRLGGRISLLGPRTDLPRLYAAADVCVLPTEQEPFGLPPLEAMACGTPAIVSRCAGVSELITDGVDGLLLDNPRDVDELASKLNRLLTSPQMREEMGREARKTAERYSWDEIARRTEALYLRLLAIERQPRAPDGGR